MEKSLQQKVLGKLYSDMQKNEPGPLSYPIHKNKLKKDERLKCKTGNHQNPRGEKRQQPLLPWLQQPLDRGLGYIGEYICQNSSNSTFKICMSPYENFTSKKN